MDDSANQDPNQSNQPISVPTGGAESSPVSVSSEQSSTAEQGVEIAVEHGPEFAPKHELSEDLKKAGVVSHPSQPAISKESQDAGISHSIPAHTFANFPTEEQAKVDLKTKPVSSADKWRAAEVIKDILRRIIGG